MPRAPRGRGARAPAPRRSRTELASLGPVNPLALEELGALEERHRFLEEQVEDVRRARRELHQVIRAVDDEIMRVFGQAFADVNEHFQALVGTLFPGGTGRLELTDPTDLLDTGVEVEARPAGKNVRKLSLLSGGERSLVALAFLFAVFRSRPSPFYLLDEVEAALDDVNLHRFLDLLHEFRGEAQLIIVSHQKRTMEAADALYGVTMTPGRLVQGGQPEGAARALRHAARARPGLTGAGRESGAGVTALSAGAPRRHHAVRRCATAAPRCPSVRHGGTVRLPTPCSSSGSSWPSCSPRSSWVSSSSSRPGPGRAEQHAAHLPARPRLTPLVVRLPPPGPRPPPPHRERSRRWRRALRARRAGEPAGTPPDARLEVAEETAPPAAPEPRPPSCATACKTRGLFSGYVRALRSPRIGGR